MFCSCTLTYVIYIYKYTECVSYMYMCVCECVCLFVQNQKGGGRVSYSITLPPFPLKQFLSENLKSAYLPTRPTVLQILPLIALGLHVCTKPCSSGCGWLIGWLILHGL